MRAYQKSFWFVGHHGKWGYSFPCDAQGVIDAPNIPEAMRDSYQQCLTGAVDGRPVEAGVVTSYDWPDPVLCRCGSGKERYSLEDARGIFVSYVCEACEASVKAKYRPGIFTDTQYPSDEPIEED